MSRFYFSSLFPERRKENKSEKKRNTREREKKSGACVKASCKEYAVSTYSDFIIIKWDTPDPELANPELPDSELFVSRPAR